MNLDIATAEGAADGKLNETSAAAKTGLTGGYVGCWVTAR